MGWVLMSERELNRVEVLAQVDDGRLSVDNAANMLDLTRRQIFRLLKRYRQDGASALRHKSRGRSPNNQIHAAKRDYALSGSLRDLCGLMVSDASAAIPDVVVGT